MREAIFRLLSDIEREKNVRILYACESGSRAWGFHSEDSDYDIRFIYAASKYLGVSSPQDTIEIAIKDDLDPGGWDVRKALGLLAKSNGPLIEWLHSPIVYIDRENFCENWQKLSLEILQPSKLWHHYVPCLPRAGSKRIAALRQCHSRN